MKIDITDLKNLKVVPRLDPDTFHLILNIGSMEVRMTFEQWAEIRQGMIEVG